MARLVLNLRAFGNETSNQVAELAGPSTRLQPVPFQCQTHAESRILGNIGAPLDYGQWDSGQFDCDMPENDALARPSAVVDCQAMDLEHGSRDGGDLQQEMCERSSGESPVRVSVSDVGVPRHEILSLTPSDSDRTLDKLTMVHTLRIQSAWVYPDHPSCKRGEVQECR